jgi:GntR family transcriptional repressor for pyruvate dehydrogenase complex
MVLSSIKPKPRNDMKHLLEPIKSESLKDVFVNRFEHFILSGKLSIGQRLPSERELALQLGVSRPVVHEGLVELAARGLVSMKPRWGTVVNDYRTEGSLALLNSLVNYHNGGLESGLLDSMLEMRDLFEVETAGLAALRRTDDQLAGMEEIIAREESTKAQDSDTLTELDFMLHHLVAMASGNRLYPLLLNSFKEVYTNLSGQFFVRGDVADTVAGFHRELVSAIRNRDEKRARKVMKKMLDHGREHLLTLANGE